ncbi:TraB/GumN family protein [Sphingosinicella sp. YJ22]|uniref:TraB/GumN family protein n=1 Tax=Sphingosinicella sp. YJ22 TaxID=1104780 RepID=UPI0014094432|nr:TraB/GumN family protein [Sphingosinicella sp. YJ22]
MADVRALLKRCALLAAALLGCWQPADALAETAPAGAPAPRPAIWLIEDEDTKIYLFGTIHVFPASLDWRSARLDEVIAEADELVMETPDASSAEMFSEDRMFAPMMMGKTVPILSRVSPEARPALEAALASTGLPVEAYDEMHIWAVAFMLTGFQMTQAFGEEASGAPVALSGAEEVLGRIFRKSRRPIYGVETIEEQIRVFSTMPLDVQRRFLEATVTGNDSPPADSPGPSSDADWVSGNVDAIAAEMRTMPAEIYEPLLTRRNRNWTQWLERRMARPGTVLFAVGAGHLAGPDSVQRMLAERGIMARRID